MENNRRTNCAGLKGQQEFVREVLTGGMMIAAM
jgi:hypothetical protein